MKNFISTLPPGAILHGKAYTYTIEKTLGQGSFGITYLATTQVQTQGPLGSITSTITVAVKEFFMKEINGREDSTVTSGSKGDGLYEKYRKKFINEANNLAKLNHPNIIKVLEAFECNNTVYYAMEYIDGGSLDDLIAQKQGLTEKETLRLTLQIASALSYMHQHKMLHLDLKPGNIMMKNGNAVLIDFGLSKQYDDSGEPESSTTVGSGTPGYAPIEQANYHDGHGFPVTMDVYALGGTMFKMLVGHRAPDASEILNDGFPADELKAKGVSANTIAIIEKAMAPLRKNRFQSVDEVIKSLDADEDSSFEKTVIEDSKTDDDTDIEESTVDKENSKEPVSVKEPKAFTDKKKYIIGITILLFVVVGGGLCFQGLTKSNSKQNSTATTNNSEVNEAERKRIIDNLVANMVYVEGGTFTMGATKEQLGGDELDALPPHKVKLSSFKIGKYEVTQDEWKAVMGNNPSYNKRKGDYAVENVSWYDCQKFIKELNALTGRHFRLPTEAEWEYAARGGNKSKGYKFSGSDTPNDVAWFWGNSQRKIHKVGQKQPNELGIYDMSGNVYEWCEDWKGYENDIKDQYTNPTGPAEGLDRVVRGGDRKEDYYKCRVSSRFHSYEPDRTFDTVGLRLAE